MKKVKDILYEELFDDVTLDGEGISFVGERVIDFIEETGISEDASIEELNEELQKCGILTVD